MSISRSHTIIHATCSTWTDIQYMFFTVCLFFLSRLVFTSDFPPYFIWTATFPRTFRIHIRYNTLQQYVCSARGELLRGGNEFNRFNSLKTIIAQEA